MEAIDPAVANYLRGPPPHKLEIGAGSNGKPGWLATDLNPYVAPNGTRVVAMDATKPFPIPADSFDFIFTEYMIEHIGFDDGLNMLSECYRILKPNGVLRLVTPSLGFLLKVVSADRSVIEERYREWSVTTCEIYPPAATDAFLLNNFVRAWGRAFIYDQETLRLALTLAGFREISDHDLNASAHEPLRNIEAMHRLPPDYLNLESMIFEAVKGPAEDGLSLPGRNLALGRMATQSSASPWSRAPTPEEDAAGVVSGIWTNSYNCHTAIEDRPWWRVDLGSVCRIRQVRIYNRLSNLGIMQRTGRFEIHVSDDDATWRTVFRKDNDLLMHGRKQMPFIWIPEQKIRARFLRVQLLGRTYLHLRQVEVFGEDDGEGRDAAGNSTLSPIEVPRSPATDGPRSGLAKEIDEKIAAHPDTGAWLEEASAGPTLGIIIPYRRREEHLRRLLPHLISFFNRDHRNRRISPLVVVSEQADDEKFNRGRCCNCGFLAVERHCDYLCFHDVDYLPMWADYSYSAFPARIIESGLNLRPVRATADNKLWVTIPSNALAAVVVIDRKQFLAVNGFSNGYHGWGMEDADLQARFDSLGLFTKTRDGTFIPLDHDHAGFTATGEKNQDWLDNEARLRHLRPQYHESRSFREGLGTTPMGEVDVAFELWSGLDESESRMICRLRIKHADQTV